MTRVFDQIQQVQKWDLGSLPNSSRTSGTVAEIAQPLAVFRQTQSGDNLTRRDILDIEQHQLGETHSSCEAASVIAISKVES